jgi:hypothetical protein
MDPKFCPQHPKLETLIETLCEKYDEIKVDEQRQWESIAKKAATSSIKWGVIVFVGIMIATVGFLWNNQRENRNEILVKIDSLSNSIIGENGLRDQVREMGWKVDQHVKSWPTPEEKHPNRERR